jgi:5-methylcytosine-specific restriction endonuclease McrA
MSIARKKRYGENAPSWKGGITFQREEKLKRLIEMHGAKCWYCGLDLTGQSKHIDHIIPKSDNGSDNIDNLALTCPFCNHAKHDLTLGLFLEWLYWVKKQDKFPVIDEFE